jgi:hypothetical protein
MALDEFDRHMAHLQLAAAFRDQKPRDAWLRGIRSLLRMSMEDFAVRIELSQSASVKELERNKRLGTIKLITCACRRSMCRHAQRGVVTRRYVHHRQLAWCR